MWAEAVRGQLKTAFVSRDGISLRCEAEAFTFCANYDSLDAPAIVRQSGAQLHGFWQSESAERISSPRRRVPWD